MIWPRVRMTGKTALTPGLLSRIASVSSKVSVVRRPDPSDRPIVWAAPAITIIMWIPWTGRGAPTRSLAPSPTATMERTLAIPIPSIMSKVSEGWTGGNDSWSPPSAADVLRLLIPSLLPTLPSGPSSESTKKDRGSGGSRRLPRSTLKLSSS
jgi:hypothetical protein